MIRKISALFALLALTTVAHADFTTHGLPVPWPFPWAKDCPMDWSTYDGMYSLTANTSIGRLNLKVQAEGADGLLLVHVTRVNSKGKVTYDGTTYIEETQKVLALWLVPAENPRAPSVWAEIRMHYNSKQLTCADTVPVLTVAPNQDQEADATAYELIRMCESLN